MAQPPYLQPAMPVPRISMPNPHLRKPSLSNAFAEDTQRNSRGIAPVPVPAIPEQHLHRKSASLDSLEAAQIGQAVSTASPIDGLAQFSARTSATQSRAKTHSPSPLNRSDDSGYHSSSSPHKSPVVPIRSMFPTYDPAISLAQQAYHPQRPTQTRTSTAPLSSFSKAEYLDRVHGRTPIERSSSSRSAPPYAQNIPLTSLSPRLSTLQELDRLWDATHGMEPGPNIGSYDLELARIDEASFTLGATPDQPFYSLITYDTDDLHIQKTCPRKRTKKTLVGTVTVEPKSRWIPPQDGMVTYIFPRPAADMAMDQAASLALEHGFAPTHRDEIQADAIRRAAAQEASTLFWDDQNQQYELCHPALQTRRGQQESDFTFSPASAVAPQFRESKSVLRMVVANPAGRSLPVVTIHSPSQSSDVESISSGPTVPGIRMSTLFQANTDAPLLELDFNTRILHINAHSILTYLHCLYPIDSLVCALLTVLVADERVSMIMSQMEIWQPKPQRTMSTFTASTYNGNVARSTTGSVYYATLAEREEAEREAQDLAATFKKDVKESKKERPEHKRWFSSNSTKEKKVVKSKKVKIMVEEFDLEKLGHYQAGSREGQQLPSPVRLILSILVGGLNFVVWILTSMVRILTLILVSGTRCMTSERF